MDRQAKGYKCTGLAIIEILKDKELAVEMGKGGQRLVVEKYNWKKIGKDILSIFEGLV